MSPRQIKVEPIGAYRAALGEGPLWDPASGKLLWLDILNHRLLQTEPDSGATEVTALSGLVSAIAHRRAGGLLAAADNRICSLGPDGALVTLAALPEAPYGRLNDGKADALGRFWCGTASSDPAGRSALYRFEHEVAAKSVLGGVSMSNGMCWNADNTLFYYVDSATRRLDVFTFDLELGRIGERRSVIEVPAGQLPDGMCVDVDGCIWLAVWGGYHVLRITPEGKIDAELKLPTPAASSCAFGGPDGRTLFITTAQEGMTADQLAADPWAGALFAADVGVAGLPVFAAAL